MCISTDMWVKLNQIVSNAQNFCYGINAIRPHALSCADRASGCNRESERERERARSVRESYAGMDPDKNQCAVTYAYT